MSSRLIVTLQAQMCNYCVFALFVLFLLVLHYHETNVVFFFVVFLYVLLCHKTYALCVLSKPYIVMKHVHYLSQHME